MAASHPSYIRVFLTFARNSLVRDMTFRANFLIEAFSSLTWMLMNLGFYLLVYSYTRSISGWGQYEFFAFMATTMIINSLVAAFFMPNAAELSELIRTGGLDFALLKPIDTQFLVSLAKIEWSSLSNFFFGVGLLLYSLAAIDYAPPWYVILLYPFYVVCGTLIMFSLMTCLAATSIWLGRNQSLYDFWFYITIFSRYPMEIYQGSYGYPLQWFFTFLVPVLVVVNVPARLVAKAMTEPYWHLTLFALFATAASLWISRRMFQAALKSYRSASS